MLFEGSPEQPFAQRVLEILEAAYWRVGTILSLFPLAPMTNDETNSSASSHTNPHTR